MAVTLPVGSAAPTLVAVIALLMILCWAAAVVLAFWGAIRDARQVEREARHEVRENPAPGPTPGIEGFLDHWALWALALTAVGLLLLALAAALARRGL